MHNELVVRRKAGQGLPFSGTWRNRAPVQDCAGRQIDIFCDSTDDAEKMAMLLGFEGSEGTVKPRQGVTRCENLSVL